MAHAKVSDSDYNSSESEDEVQIVELSKRQNETWWQGREEKGRGQVNIAFEKEDWGIPSESTSTTGTGNTLPTGPADGAGRDNWDRPIEFLLSCISLSVGIGNVWRFPFTAYENGGGAFLIPYIIVLFFIGKPIYFLELAIGQFSASGQVKVWSMVPILKGVGYGGMIGTTCGVTYYCSLMAITIFYFIASFQAELPWAQCEASWGGELCNGTEVNWELSNKTVSEIYFEKEVFPQYENVDSGIGIPEWRLTLCLLASWVLIFLALVKGVQSSGKVAYFTAIFPYVVLFILLIRGVTLPGAWEGIKVFIIPKWSKILEPGVWYAAVAQCFFSLSAGFGPIVMFSSYNPFRHNVYRDALIISLMDTLTSLLAGFTVFSILGSLAASSGMDVEDVVKSGPGLAFISYPDAIAKFDWVPQLFSILFFLMLFTLGIGSATSMTSGVITVICDQWPSLKRWHVTLGVSIIGFSLGLIYITPGGQFMLTLVDYFGTSFVIIVMATLEVIGVAWIYGLNNFCADIEFMLGIKVGWYWKLCWGFFVPCGLITILIYSLINSEQIRHNDVDFPPLAIAAGWILSGVALAVVPVCAVHSIVTRKGFGFLQKVKQSVQPTSSWGPRHPQLKQDWMLFKSQRS